MSEQIINARVGVRSRAVPHPQSMGYKICLGIGFAMLACLVYGGSQILRYGHEVIGTTKEAPWGVFICNYAWAISSIGLSYIASFGIVLGVREFDVIGRRALYLALLIVIAGMMNVGLDLEQPFRAWHMLLTPHMSAPMGMVAPALFAYAVLVSAELYLVISRGHHDIVVKAVAVAAFITAVIVHSYHGAIFGLSHSRSLWFGPYYPIYFLLSALYASSGMIIFITVATYKLAGAEMSHRLKNSLTLVGKMLAYLLFIALFFEYWKMLSGWMGHSKSDDVVLSGPAAIFFWGFEVPLTYVIPLGILFWSRFRDYNKMAIAGLLVMVGLWFVRYDFVVAGELVPYLGFVPFNSALGGSAAHLAAYHPTVAEITYSIGTLGFIMTAYLLGIRYLPLHKDEEEGVPLPQSEPLISVYTEPESEEERRMKGIRGIKR